MSSFQKGVLLGVIVGAAGYHFYASRQVAPK